MKHLVKLIILILGVFRLTELFVEDEGPYQMFSRFRIWSLKNAHKSKTRQTFADLLHCPYCLSIWFSFIILVVPEKIQKALGIAGGVSLLYTLFKKSG